VKLSKLAPAEGARKSRKRVGRGAGSGHGKTSCRGHKGQRARSGVHLSPWFEGGQLPYHRRLPKRGFVNILRKEYAYVNVGELQKVPENNIVTPELLLQEKMIKNSKSRVKILGKGEINKPLVVRAHRFSKTAISKIEAAGGKAEVI
jgi:large subunit ribosomal protein L15